MHSEARSEITLRAYVGELTGLIGMRGQEF
jgi:hypothetical protein